MGSFDAVRNDDNLQDRKMLFIEGPYPLDQRIDVDDEDDEDLTDYEYKSDSNSDTESNKSSSVDEYSLNNACNGFDKLRLNENITPFRRYSKKIRVKCYPFGVERRLPVSYEFSEGNIDCNYYFRLVEDEEDEHKEPLNGVPLNDPRSSLIEILSDSYRLENVECSTDTNALFADGSSLPKGQRFQAYDKNKELYPVFQKYYSPIGSLRKFKFALGLNSKKLNVRKVIENLLNIIEHTGGNLESEYNGYATEYRNETHSFFVIGGTKLKDSEVQDVLRKAVEEKFKNPEDEGELFDDGKTLFIPGYITYKKCDN
ncbi:hypothetical protein BN7_2745 [Wickerhamomyces ciferrii]|uniref:Uncharacterized protein n=1 Tax=Wickerhamomyces ciferrii (strain ATCC 14091 / BCRC 22168 / CBS 111 / JCM 3599 / NBRC 0793 / NRRL Y-1031 F-60-10) TaxID=1206466 RepID=K0KPU8_WICCF|nr:uncharacterized protein BN7_2745 [Wickerhamomyces ciferrii]CCH43198.1 hypothetical protein BN7_2745 [Wickerhamomyces ciferrii]